MFRSLVAVLLCLSASAGATEPASTGPGGRPPEPRILTSTVRLPVLENDRLRVRRISTADGLSQTRVANIVQDDRGFLWFGTQYGLNRYDGYEFKVFVHEPGRINSLSGAYIFALFKDRDGFLWVGCNQTLDRLDPRTETFTHYEVEPRGGGLGDTVYHISQDRNGRLWLATAAGLHSLDPHTGVMAHYHHSAEDPASLSADATTWTGEDRRGNLWVGTRDGLDQFDPTTGKVRLHIPGADPFRYFFFEDHAGQFWVAHSGGNGLALYDRDSNTLAPYSFYDHDPPADGLTGVNDIVEDRDGRLWIGSWGDGLLRLDRDRQQFVRYTHRAQDPRSLSHDTIDALSKDRDGNLWVGSAFGVNVFRTEAPRFETYQHDAGDPNSLSTDFVSAIYDDSHGSLWIGTDNGLEKIERSTGRRVLFLSAASGLRSTVDSIVADASGMLWLGTSAHGLFQFDPRTQHLKSYRHDDANSNSLSNDWVHVIFIDHRGRLWVGTEDGLNLFDPKTRSFHVYKVDPDRKGRQRYIAIAEDVDGTLWLGTHDSGLHHFDPVSGSFRVLEPDPLDPTSLRDGMTPSNLVDKQGRLWIATQNGLNRLDRATGKFSAYDVENGLPGNLVDCLLEDQRGDIWLSTNQGLSRFDPTRATFTNYSVADGLPGNDLTGWSACSRNSRGELFFGGFSGAVAFRPDRLTDTSLPPPLVLTDLQLSGRSTAVGAPGPLRQSITYTDRIVLAHEQTVFSLSFAGLQFASPETTRYRYRLGGLDEKWYEVDSTSRRATFTTLPPGNYVLQVESKAPRGAWSSPGTELRIQIQPPWWATWWIRVVYVAVAALVFWSIYRVRVEQLSRQMHVRMEERLNERTRIAQELHDTLLQGLLSASLQLSVARGHLPGSSPAKPLVERVFELLRLMIEESRNTVRGLRVRRVDDLEKAIAAIPKDLGADGVEFRILADGSSRQLRPAASQEVYWIARESIANAIRHSGSPFIETIIEYSPERFRMTVRDEGRGIDAETLRVGRDNHWGLAGMRERAQRIGGTLTMSSALGAGTEIILTIEGKGVFYGS